MYKSINKFPQPEQKILYSYFDEYYRFLVEFSKRNIYIYDFIKLRYIIFYDVVYEIDHICMLQLYLWSDWIVSQCPKNLYNQKFYQWLQQQYKNNFMRLHGFDIVKPEDDPFQKVGDFKKYCQEIEKNWIW